MNRYGLLGRTLKHSFSKDIHEYLYIKYNLNSQYDLIELEEEQLEEILTKLKTGEYLGYNVTIPYKEAVIKHLDVVSDEVEAIGACNTIKYQEGKLIGYNTDYFGFYNQIKYYNIDLTDTVYLLGSGGSSKSIKYALDKLNKNYITVSQSPIDGKISYLDLSKKLTNEYLINTTPIGMYPNVKEAVVDENIASKAKGIIDIIYNPSKTLLMSYNENSYNGLLMLIFQAVKAFEIWTDINVKLNEDMIEEIKRLIGAE